MAVTADKDDVKSVLQIFCSLKGEGGKNPTVGILYCLFSFKIEFPKVGSRHLFLYMSRKDMRRTDFASSLNIG